MALYTAEVHDDRSSHGQSYPVDVFAATESEARALALEKGTTRCTATVAEMSVLTIEKR